MKLCRGCGVEKDELKFWISKGTKDGRQSRCGICMKAAKELWLKSHPNYKANRSRDQKWRARGINITEKEYNILHERCKGLCMICGKEEYNFDRRLCVDHDHRTGKIRGLLCTHCNRGLGCFKDEVSNIENAVKYLKEDL